MTRQKRMELYQMDKTATPTPNPAARTGYADSDGSEVEDEDSEDEKEDDEEPTLKYDRLGGSVHDLLHQDSAPALAYANKKLQVLGTHARIIHISDLKGERLRSVKPQAHSASIINISVDETGDFIATASIDVLKGVNIYNTTSQMRIIFIDRPADSPRVDLLKCTLHWQDDSTLLIAWADQIKVARIRARPRSTTVPSATLPPIIVEITAVFHSTA
ncbi:hypothetical protein BC629DRAFT_1592628 [Irpex lacteus]|nr:hypothetical protein BC629DRAFT_1592628 [Irpex lacteus]